MTDTQPGVSTFHKGDKVVLVQGTYQGTLGVFVGLRKDAAWADIAEHNGAVRSHPMVWLGHVAEPDGIPVDLIASVRESQ